MGTTRTATFIDFDDLATFAERVATPDGVGVDHIEWTLTDVTRHRTEREIRQEAVRPGPVITAPVPPGLSRR